MNNRLEQKQSTQGGLEQQQRADAGQKQSFDTAESAIAADRAQTPVPEALGGRIAESISQEAPAPPPRSWWRRLFGG